MAYDPYGPQQPEQQITGGSIAKEIITAPFKPSTYLSTYLMWPGNYSTTKGIWSPVATKGETWKQSFNSVFQKVGDKKVLRASKIPGALKDLGPFGNNRFGADFLNITEHNGNFITQKWNKFYKMLSKIIFLTALIF
jgi:hypothetical protein